MNTIRIRQLSKVKQVKNPISGHEWAEETLLNRFEVVGRVGVVATCNSFEKAEKISAEWQAFYDKFPAPDYR